MTEAIQNTARTMGLLLKKRQTLRLFLGVVAVYLLLYLYAIGDLGFHLGQRGFTVRFSAQPLQLLFKTISPFYFEAIALVQMPFVTYLFSPMNLLLGLILAVLVGLNLTISYLAVKVPKVCRGNPATGVLASLPGLLAGSACCGPIVLLVLGIQASASLIAFFGWLIPIAIVLLLGTLFVNGRRTNIQYLQDTIN